MTGVALHAQGRSPGAPAASDEELVAAARADPLSFAPLYQRYLARIYRYCHIKLGDRQAAEDATSEVFLKAFANLQRFRGDVFAAWLYTIARHVVIDQLRERRPTEPLEAAERFRAAGQAGGEAERQRALLSAALAELPEEQRAVLELQCAGWSGQEIAAALLLAGGLFVVSPQARVFAQGSLEGLLAQFGFTRAAPERPRFATVQPTADGAWSMPIPEPTLQPDTARPAFTRADVQAQVSFAVKDVTYLPAGYREVAPLTPSTDGTRKWVTWHAAAVERRGCDMGISLLQEPVPAQTSLRPPMPLGDSPVTMVIVGDAPGLWIEGFAQSQCDSPAVDGQTLVTTTGTGSLLIWDRDGVRYQLTTSSSLGLDEALKVAESLRGDSTGVTPVPINPELQDLSTPRPMLGQVPGQRLRGKLVITFAGERYAGWRAYASDEPGPALAQADLFAPAIAALRDPAIPTGQISDSGDTLGRRYVVVEVW